MRANCSTPDLYRWQRLQGYGRYCARVSVAARACSAFAVDGLFFFFGLGCFLFSLLWWHQAPHWATGITVTGVGARARVSLTPIARGPAPWCRSAVQSAPSPGSLTTPRIRQFFAPASDRRGVHLSHLGLGAFIRSEVFSSVEILLPSSLVWHAEIQYR